LRVLLTHSMQGGEHPTVTVELQTGMPPQLVGPQVRSSSHLLLTFRLQFPTGMQVFDEQSASLLQEAKSLVPQPVFVQISPTDAQI
jgi:hypothetical protein